MQLAMLLKVKTVTHAALVAENEFNSNESNTIKVKTVTYGVAHQKYCSSMHQIYRGVIIHLNLQHAFVIHLYNNELKLQRKSKTNKHNITK